MNAMRRKAIREIQEKLLELHELIENVYDDESEAYENLPESLQYSERGETMQEAVDALDSAMSSCEEISEYLDTAMGA